MPQKTVLLSGAGIAGATLAYWLARAGFAPTVVEQSPGTRSSGNPVDVRGEAVDVAAAMGVMSRLTAAATRVRTMRIVDGRGREVATMDLTPARRGSGAREVEVPRDLLSSILLEAARDQAEFLFDESVAAMTQDAGGVDVVLAGGAQRRFDLVIGTDGLHSNIRRLAFAPESEVIRHLGVYVATLRLDSPPDDPSSVLMYNVPGRSTSIHPGAGKPSAAFIFRGPLRPDLDHRDVAAHKQLVLDAYRGLGWRVPELLDRLRAIDDLYFDAVSQVVLDHWWEGRVGLVGDAASCVSLFGEGSSLAIIGARTLARALAETREATLAFRRYEAIHRALVTPRQRGIGLASRMIVPATRGGILVRNTLLRLLALRRGAVRRGPR